MQTETITKLAVDNGGQIMCEMHMQWLIYLFFIGQMKMLLCKEYGFR